jgi:hypothetical protein
VDEWVSRGVERSEEKCAGGRSGRGNNGAMAVVAKSCCAQSEAGDDGHGMDQNRSGLRVIAVVEQTEAGQDNGRLELTGC